MLRAGAACERTEFRPTALALRNEAVSLESGTSLSRRPIAASTPAHLQAETTSGAVRSDFPVNRDPRERPHRLDHTLGSGGPLVQVATTNGDLSFKRAGSSQ